MKFKGLFLLLSYPTFIPITYGRNVIRKNSLFFSSFAIFVVISSPISTSYCVLHLLPKSTNRLRYSLRIFYSSRHPRDRCDSSLDKKPSHVCLPVYIPCAMCKSCKLYVRVVAGYLYARFVAMHIYSRSQASRSHRGAYQSSRKGFSRNKYFVDCARVIVVGAIESSCASFSRPLQTRRFRPT